MESNVRVCVAKSPEKLTVGCHVPHGGRR